MIKRCLPQVDAWRSPIEPLSCQHFLTIEMLKEGLSYTQPGWKVLASFHHFV